MRRLVAMQRRFYRTRCVKASEPWLEVRDCSCNLTGRMRICGGDPISHSSSQSVVSYLETSNAEAILISWN